MVAGTVSNCLWLSWAYRRKFITSQGSAPAIDFKTSQFFRYSLPLALRGASGFLFLKVNIWMIGWLATEFDAGQFRLVDQFLTIPALILSATLAAVAPRIAESQVHGPSYLSNLVYKVYGFMLLLTVPMAVAIWFNRPLLQLLFPDYMASGTMLMVFAPAMAVQGLGYAASIVLVQGSQPGAAFMITLISGLTNVLAAWVGFRINGVMGLVTATAVVHFLTHTATVIIMHWLFKMPFRVRFH